MPVFTHGAISWCSEDFSCGKNEPVFSGDIAKLECEVSGTGYQAPKLRWKNSKNLRFKETHDLEGKVNYTREFKVKTTAELYITPDMLGMTFTCDLSFAEELELLKSSPEFTSSCTRVLNVVLKAQPPTNLRIAGEAATSGLAKGGEQITCEADGHPKPEFHWVVDGQAVGKSGPVYTFPYVKETVTKTLTCNAMNTIDGVQQIGTIELTVTVSSTPIPQDPILQDPIQKEPVTETPVEGVRRSPSSFPVPMLTARDATTIRGMQVPDDPTVLDEPTSASGDLAGIIGGITGCIALIGVLSIVAYFAYTRRRRGDDGSLLHLNRPSILHLNRERTATETSA
jgi:hypothetical protein